jgi:uncharacterized membrane protein YdbT with pleckstrin-like domain
MPKSWISKNLNNDERVLFETRLFMFPVLKYLMFCFIIPYLKYKHTEYIVTNQRVLRKYGIFSIHESEIPLDKINSVKFDQSLLGRIFRYGSIHIETASRDGVLSYPKVAKAKDFKTQILIAQETFQEANIKKYAELLAAAIASKQQIHNR